MMVETYQHSGSVGTTGIPLMAIVGGISAILLGILYTYVLAWIPFIYVSFLATAGFGAVLGLVVGWSARLAKVRNPFLIGLLGLACGVLGLYVSWAFDGIARFGATDFPGILLSFGALKSYIEVFYNEGFWGIGRAGGMVSGIPLALIWVTEAGIILGASWLLAGGFIVNHPFCENCNRWTERTEGLCQLHPPEDNENAVAQLCEGDISVLSQFQKSPPEAAAFLRIDTAHCPDCSECNCVTVNLAQITIDKDGNASTNTQTLVQDMILSANDMEQLRTTVTELPMAQFAVEDEGDDEEEGEEVKDA